MQKHWQKHIQKYWQKIVDIVISPITLGIAVTAVTIYVALRFYVLQTVQNQEGPASPTKSFYQLLTRLHQISIDLRLRQRGYRAGSDDVIVLTVDEKAIERLGQWPWPREVIAKTIQRAIDLGAKVVGFDIIFAEEDKKSAVPVLKALKNTFTTHNSLSPLAREAIDREIIAADTDKKFTDTLAKIAPHVVMGMYFDGAPTGLPPHADICLQRMFTKTRAFRLFEIQEIPTIVMDSTEIAWPEGIKQILDIKLQTIEADRIQEWLKQKKNVPIINNINQIFQSQLSPEQLEIVFHHWLEYDLIGLRQFASELKTIPAAEINNHVDSLFTTLLPSERVPLAYQINNDKLEYCARWLSEDDEMLPIMSEAWADIAKDSKKFSAMSMPDAIGYIQSASHLNLVPATGRWWTNIPDFDANTKHTGFFNAEQDPDGTIRRSMLTVHFGESYLTSLPLKMFLVANEYTALLKVDPIETLLGQKGVTQLVINDSEGEEVFKVPVDRSGQLMINFAGPRKMFAYLSVADLLSGQDQVSVEQLVLDSTNKPIADTRTVSLKDYMKNKLILFGATATGIYDLRVTPFEKNYPGVETHANVLDNLLRHDFLRSHPSEEQYMLITLIVLGVFLTLMLSYLSAMTGMSVTVLTFAAIYMVDRYYLFKSGYVTVIIFPIILVFALFTVLTFYKYMTEERKKKELKSTFGKYVSPAIVEEILKHPDNIELGGRKEIMTVFFSDVRGFTTISEKLDPRALSDLLNSYLTPMTQIVFQNRGTLDKYMGDAVMAFFGAPIHDPKHAHNACRCALQSVAKLKLLQEDFKRLGLPMIDLGIGLNTGEMSVGNMGSDIVRNFTVMGDAVNLGSRLEGINKEYGTRIMLSEFTHAAIQDSFVTREVDRVRVKGKLQPVKIFELMGENNVPAETLAMLKHFKEGYNFYHAKNWGSALDSFHQALSLVPDDAVIKLYIERCTDYKENPPPDDWDGVFVMKTK